MEIMDKNEKLKIFITKLLLSLGFSPRHGGFYPLRQMIILYYHKRASMQELYEELSRDEEFLCDAKSFERIIRHAFNTAKNQDNFKLLNCLFGAKVVSDYGLCVSEFISIVVEYLKHFWNGSDEITT